jgi:hypothetical protein
VTNQCFTCGERLEPVFKDAAPQYDGAVMFYAAGNYGSTVFDLPPREIRLVINICDPCLVAGADRVLEEITPVVRPDVSYAPWKPEGAEGR